MNSCDEFYLNLYFLEANKLYKEGNLPEARKMYDLVISGNPQHADAWDNSGCLKDDMGDIEGAFHDKNHTENRIGGNYLPDCVYHSKYGITVFRAIQGIKCFSKSN